MPSNDIHVFRLLPGADLKRSIQQFAQEHHIVAGWISTCVGSLELVSLRFANQPEASVRTGPLEILSLSGTVSTHGSHLHICVADGEGNATGGHLLEGSRIFTTAEIVITTARGHIFRREPDVSTGFRELIIED